MNNNVICGHWFFVIVDRYIQRAGKVGCCNWRYPSMVKQVELMWAEKEPRRSGKRGSGHNGVVSSRPRSPMNPRAHVGSNPDPPLLSWAHHIPLILQHIPTTSHFEEFHLPIVREIFVSSFILVGV
ncbi:hypothetical protein CFP56_036171 [Quercus suber]|uniref:Uncharacterized protein n=1 Tax=Quercus suber TaxID=58331 RepID=A0AAW0LNS0_QUESU